MKNEEDELLDRILREGLPTAEGEDSLCDRVFSFFGQASTAPSQRTTRLRSGQVVGDYRLEELVGEGGMGQVWRAWQASLRRWVALKFVRPDRSSGHARELLAREARAGARLAHPGIVRVHAYGEAQDLSWLAMEFVDGAWSLRDFLDVTARQEHLPQSYHREVAQLVVKLCSALHAAHEAGVIHRDLKPQNVLVDPDGEPRITDFGLARIADEEALSVSGDIAGTYAYMSPEQLMAKRSRIDHRTDIFSLGVVLYEMLAFRRPFDGDTTHQVADRILHHQPVDLLSIRSRIPRELATICGKCMEKDPDRRYPSMRELHSDLERYLTNEPIRAQPISALRKLQLWTRRRPAASVGAAAAIIGFTTISILLASYVALSENQRRTIVDLARSDSEVAGSQGRWLDALRKIELAEASAQRPTTELVLRRIDTLIALGRAADARSFAESAARDLEDDEIESGLLLRLGAFDLYEWGSVDPGVRRIDLALAGQLSPADEDFARAALAASAPEAIEACRDSLAHDPAHPWSSFLLLGLLALSAHHQEAETEAIRLATAFPEAGTTVMGPALLEAMAGDSDGLEAMRNRMIEAFGMSEATDMLAILHSCASIASRVTLPYLLERPSNPFDLTQKQVRDMMNAPWSRVFRRLCPRVRCLNVEVPRALRDQDFHRVDWKALERECEVFLERIPDGYVLNALAIARLMNDGAAHTADEQARRAGEILWRASEAHTMVPDSERFAFYWWLHSKQVVERGTI